MGEVIRKDAAAADIHNDVVLTLTRATAKGGDWQTSAEARLSPIVMLANLVATRVKSAKEAVVPVQAELDAADDGADALIGRISDDIWNLVGRPAHDPILDILFPDGFSYYTGGDTETQPDRMDLLGELLVAGIHPRLDADRGKKFAAEIAASSAVLRAKVEAAHPIHARIALAERMQTAVGRT